MPENQSKGIREVSNDNDKRFMKLNGQFNWSTDVITSNSTVEMRERAVVKVLRRKCLRIIQCMGQ